MREQDIGDIGNYYGCLTVRNNDGVYQWSIENYSGHNWQDIPESLYLELVKFQTGPKVSECAQ
jgi:hypothetical protein